MKVVVLAGGKGTRLGLAETPKVMVPIDGVPLLERTVRGAIDFGFTDFIFMTGYLSETIEAHFGEGTRFGASIEYVREEKPLGTAGCFKLIRDRLTEPFLVIYGDLLMDVDLAAFAEFARQKGGAGTLFAHPNDHPFDSDLLEVDTEDLVLEVHPKPHRNHAHYPNLVSAAVYVLYPVALDYLPSVSQSDWGRDVFPKLVKSTSLYAYRSCEYTKDIGTPDRLDRAERHLREGRLDKLALRTKKPAVFLDRDGVINQERGGVHKPHQVELIPGAAAAIRAFNDAGVPVICVTNQPDLAKGKMSWADLRSVTGEIDHRLAKEAGAYLDDIRICPHHPERGWVGEVKELKVECSCRKPQAGLLRDAAAFHNIDLSRSWLAGDRYCDIAAASSVGVRSILVRTGHAGGDRDKFSLAADCDFPDLAAATPKILEALA